MNCLLKKQLRVVALLAFAVAARVSAASLQVASPMPYAVFQRSDANIARVPIAGSADVEIARVEAAVTLMTPYSEGTDGRSTKFTEIARPNRRDFQGVLEVAAGGWYELKVRALNAQGGVVAETTVSKVGVGEVIVAAGHSFCANSQGDRPGRAQDDRVATCADWKQEPPSPLAFRHCDDPLRPATADRASPWPAVGDELVKRWHVPVLILCTGVGGSTVEEWRNGAEYPEVPSRAYPGCRATLKKITPYTGLRAIVWFGNENDLPKGPTAEVFADNLRQVIALTRMDSGYPDLPWIIALDAYDPGVIAKVGHEEKLRRKERIDRGTEMVLETVPYAYDGPQTDDLGPEFRRSDRDHFNEAGVQQLGVRFARKIDQALFPGARPHPLLPRHGGE